VLVIIVSPDGDVQNRVIFTDRFLRLATAGGLQLPQRHYAGLAIEQVRERLQSEVERLRAEVATLMQAAVNVSAEAMNPSPRSRWSSRASAICCR
jgi:heat-inducible transcriptional repressor